MRTARHVTGRGLLMAAAGLGAAGVAAGIVAGAGAVLAARAVWHGFQRFDLRGRRALITGGSRGLGLALAEEFAREGCSVAICARDREDLERAAAGLRRQGAQVLALECDITDREQVARVVATVRETFGAIDILVNNAGMIEVGPMGSQTVANYEEAMNVMFWGLVNTTLEVAPEMIRRREGRIANITSIGGKVSMPHLLPYSCAKFAAVGFSEGIAAELANTGVRVTTVVPGLMRTGSHVNAYFKGNNRAEYAWFSLGATSPVTAISARRAARRIVRAVRRGEAEITLGVSAKALAFAHGVAPGATVHALGLVNRLLPDNTSAERHTGHESQSAITESPLTTMGRAAGKRLNQYRAQAPRVAQA